LKHDRSITSFEVLTAMIQVVFFWAVTLCSDVVGFQHFGGPCYRHPVKLLVYYHFTTEHHNTQDNMNVPYVQQFKDWYALQSTLTKNFYSYFQLLYTDVWCTTMKN